MRNTLLSEKSARSVRDMTNALPEDVARAARRFLVTLARRKQLLRDSGWQNCRVCGALSETQVCPACASEARDIRRQHAVQTLKALPWLDARGLLQQSSEFLEEDYAFARDYLLSWWSYEAQVVQRKRNKAATQQLKVLACNLTMLLTHTPPDRLDDTAIVASVQPRILRKLGLL